VHFSNTVQHLHYNPASRAMPPNCIIPSVGKEGIRIKIPVLKHPHSQQEQNKPYYSSHLNNHKNPLIEAAVPHEGQIVERKRKQAEREKGATVIAKRFAILPQPVRYFACSMLFQGKQINGIINSDQSFTLTRWR